MQHKSKSGSDNFIVLGVSNHLCDALVRFQEIRQFSFVHIFCRVLSSFYAVKSNEFAILVDPLVIRLDIFLGSDLDRSFFCKARLPLAKLRMAIVAFLSQSLRNLVIASLKALFVFRKLETFCLLWSF